MKRFMGTGGIGGYARVYLAADCLEVEQHFPVDILRHRIYLDDVILVTRSQRFGWPLLAVSGVFGALCGMAALGFAIAGEALVCILFAVATAAMAVIFVARLLTRLEVITIFGRRKKIEIVFGLDKAPVQTRFDEIVAAVRDKIEATELTQNLAAAKTDVPPESAEFPAPAPVEAVIPQVAEPVASEPERVEPELPFMPEIPRAPVAPSPEPRDEWTMPPREDPPA